MLNLLIKWFVFALLIILVSYFIPGIEVENFGSALYICLVMALINTFIKPIIMLLTLPLNLLTFGLLSLFVNALMFMLAGAIVPGFEVESFLSAFFGSILLSFLGFIVRNF